MVRFQTVTPTRGKAPSHSPPDVRYAPGLKLARRLGWFSLALGTAQVLAPRMLCRYTGVQNESLMQAYGLREIACGIGILSSPRPAGWMWARAAGDILDLGTLGYASLQGTHEEAQAAMISATAVAGVAALDVLAATQLSAAAALEG